MCHILNLLTIFEFFKRCSVLHHKDGKICKCRCITNNGLILYNWCYYCSKYSHRDNITKPVQVKKMFSSNVMFNCLLHSYENSSRQTVFVFLHPICIFVLVPVVVKCPCRCGPHVHCGAHWLFSPTCVMSFPSLLCPSSFCLPPAYFSAASLPVPLLCLFSHNKLMSHWLKIFPARL